jgi:hypothetical protein
MHRVLAAICGLTVLGQWSVLMVPEWQSKVPRGAPTGIHSSGSLADALGAEP